MNGFQKDFLTLLVSSILLFGFAGLSSCSWVEKAAQVVTGGGGDQGQAGTDNKPASLEGSPSMRKQGVSWVEAESQLIASGEGMSVQAISFQQLLPLSAEVVSKPDIVFGVSVENELYLFSSSSMLGRKIGSLPGKSDHLSLNHSADSLVTSYRNAIRVLSLPDLKTVKSLERIPAVIQSIDVSETDDIALLGGADGRVYRWAWTVEAHPSEREHGRFDVEKYFAHASIVSAVRYHPSGRVFFTGDWTGAVFAWRGFEQDPFGGSYDENIFGTGFFTETAARKPLKGTPAGRVDSLVINKAGTYLFIANDTGEVDIWKLRGIKRALKIKNHRGAISSVVVSDDGDYVVTYGRDQRLVATHIEKELDPLLGEYTYTPKVEFEGRVPLMKGGFFSADKVALLASEKGLMRLDLNLDTPTLLPALEGKAPAPGGKGIAGE